jgi:hypothetical protein
MLREHFQVMNIAIIGYGSLIWDLDDLEPHVAGPWRRGAGPRLPVEFSRISPKRKRALVLVVDETVQTPSPISVIASARGHPDDAVADLARRERCPPERLSVATRGGNQTSSRFPLALAAVADWLAASPYDAAIWTELDSNFAAHTGTAFSLAAAELYLRALTGDSLQEAWRYLESAPVETDTPLRRHMRAQGWWRALAFSARNEEATGHAAEPA